MHTINTRELKTLIDNKETFLLLNVLSQDSFDEGHIPGSVNVPLDTADFVKRVEQAAGAKDTKIVVYCGSRDCTASPKAAKRLAEAGFMNVLDYEEGMAGWRLAGYEVSSVVTADR